MPTFSISGKNVSAKTANSALKKHLLSLSIANAKKFEGQKVVVINKDSKAEKIILVSVVKELSKPKNVSVEGKRVKSAVDIKLKNWGTKRKRANTKKSTKKTAKKAKKAGKTASVVRINPGKPLEKVTNLSNASVLQNPQLGQQLLAPKIGNPILGGNNKALRNLGAFHDQYDVRRSLPPSAGPVNTKSATIVRSDPVNTAKFQNDLRKLQDANNKLKDTKNQLEVELKQERQNSSEYKKDADLSKNLISDIEERLSSAKTSLAAAELALRANPKSDALIGMITQFKNNIKTIEDAKKQIERGNFDPQINDSLNAAQITGLKTEKKKIEKDFQDLESKHKQDLKEYEQKISQKEKQISEIEQNYNQELRKYKKEEDAINEQKLKNNAKIEHFGKRDQLNKLEKDDYLKELEHQRLLNQKWSDLIKEQKQLSDKKIDAETRSKDLEEEVKKLKDEKKSLDVEFKQTKLEKEQLAKEKEQLAKEKEQLAKEKEKYQASLSTSKTNEETLEKQKEDLEESIKNLEEERKGLNQQLENSKQGQDLLNRLDKYISILKQNAEVDIPEEVNLTSEDKQKRIEQVKEAIKVYDAIRKNKLNEASNLIINYSEAQGKIKDLESQITNIQSEHKRNENEKIKSLQSEIEGMRSAKVKNDNLSKQLAQVQQKSLDFLNSAGRVNQMSSDLMGGVPQINEENKDIGLLIKHVERGDFFKVVQLAREGLGRRTNETVSNQEVQNALQNQVDGLSNLTGVQRQAGLQLEGTVANLEEQIVSLKTNKRELEQEYLKLQQDREQLKQAVDSYDTNPLNSKKRKHHRVAPTNKVENKNVRLQDEIANLRQVNRELRLHLAKRTQNNQKNPKKPNLKNRITFINNLENKNESKEAIEKEIAISGESGGAMEVAKSEEVANSEEEEDLMEEVANSEEEDLMEEEVATPKDLMKVDNINL